MLPSDLPLLNLHCHSVLSILDGASTIDQYVAHTKETGGHALGLTDHGWMIGALELYQKCKKAGLTPLPGCEFYLIPDKNHEFAKKSYDYYHVTAWSTSERGYRNLLKLGSLAWGQDEVWGWREGRLQKIPRVVKKFKESKPRITFEELFEHHEGLAVGSGCIIGAATKALLQGEYVGAEINLLRLLEVFRGRFFTELMPHCVTHNWDKNSKSFVHNECSGFAPDGDLQKACNLKMIEMSRKHHIPLLMTTDSHFVHPSEKAKQDVLLQNSNPFGWRFHNTYACMTTQQAWDHWSQRYGDDKANRLIFAEAVENNHVLADMAKDIQIHDDYHQPEVKIDADIRGATSTESEALKVQILRQVGQHGRMRWDDPKYSERLATEMAVICDNGSVDFSRYFLFLEEWNRWARQHSILSAPGRGSGAGSLLCYLLKITHLNPIDHDLPFERFLSAGRIARRKYPDIDWDLGEREILLAKLEEEYGDRFAQCSTHGTLKIKSAIKDICRVLLGWNSQDPRVNDLTKKIPLEPTGVTSEAFLFGYEADGVQHQGYIERDPALKKFFSDYPQVKDMVIQLLGIPRSVGRHASAFFISDRSIHESVPTFVIGGHVCTQYTAVPAEKAGLIKFDFLRVNTLADISHCVRRVQQRSGYQVERKRIKIGGHEFSIWEGDLPVEQVPGPDGVIRDIYQLPEDPAVFKDLTEGKTETVFQLNTGPLTDFCKRVKPTSIDDLAAIVALVRPGPLTGLIGEGDLTMAEAYIKRKNGESPISYAHPGLEPILKDTYGIFLYQEQIQRAFSDLAGYSLEKADEMRELLAKKKKQDVEKILPEIRHALRERGWTEDQIAMFISVCLASAQYSFNKAHSYSYGVVAYQSAFLKHHFPLEWWASVLSNAKIEDITEKGYGQAMRDILVMPHVNGPMEGFDLIDGKLHAPLYLLDGVGDAACNAIRTARAKGGVFISFQDFYERIDRRAVNQKTMHQFIMCGAFDLIAHGASTRALLEMYHLFRAVDEHRKAKDTTPLLEAAQKFLESKKTYEIPEAYIDDVDLEASRVRHLPIYQLDVLVRFKEKLKQQGFLTDETRITFRSGFGTGIEILKSLATVESGDRAGWVGFIRSIDTFDYYDKKEKKPVTACKIQIVNRGETLECILWANQYRDYLASGPIHMNRITFCQGSMRESLEPGKWSMYADLFKQFI